ncbi:MAG: glycosyltransferase family 39 protein [Armatimonadetes bacterium]|nr:glycosyltransferase family 39 protein [Armatimonadota bacterium]
MLLKKYPWIILILIIFLGGILRTYQIKEKGLFFYDEGIYLSFAKDKFQKLLHLKENKIERQIKYSFFSSGGKFGYCFFILINFFLFGLKDYASLLVSSFFGIFTLYLIFLYSKRIYKDYSTALLSALILALSGFHIMYSRHGLPQSLSIFFLYLSLYLYLLSLNNNIIILALSGFSLGYAVSAHYNLILYIIIFMFFELINYFKNKSKFRRFLILFTFSILPLFLWQSLTLIDKIKFFGFFPETYFQELKSNFGAVFQQTSYGIDPFFAMFYLQKMEGWIIFISFILGSFFLIKKIKKNFNLEEFSLLTFALFPLIWYGFYPHLRVLRSFACVSPALAVIASWFIFKIFKNKKIILNLLIILIILIGINNAVPIIKLKSVYAKTADYLKTKKYNMVSAPLEMYPIWNFYLGDKVYPLENLRNLKNIPKKFSVLINIWHWDKKLTNYPYFKSFPQSSFSAFNAEGGMKDKYIVKNIPKKMIYLYYIKDLK